MIQEENYTHFVTNPVQPLLQPDSNSQPESEMQPQNFQPQPTLQNQFTPEQPQLLSQQQIQQEVQPQPHLTPSWKTAIFHWWHRIALVILLFHGLLGLIESCKFIFVEYPELSHALELHQVEQAEVNQLLSGMIITILFTCFTFAVALRLSKVTETTAHNIDLLIATTLILVKNPIKQFLFNLDLIGMLLYALS